MTQNTSDKSMTTKPTPQRVYKIRKLIGEGSFGGVFKCEGPDGALYACKSFRRRGFMLDRPVEKPSFSVNRNLLLEKNGLGQEGAREEYIQEATIFRYLDNRIPGICKSVEFGSGCIIMELYKKGNLRDNGPCAERGERNLRTICGRLYKLFNTVRLLHESHLAHLDIKPDNIMVSDEGDYILGDLGNCAFVRQPVYDSCSFKEKIPDIGLMPRLDRNITMQFCPPEGLKSTMVSFHGGLLYRPEKEAQLQHIWYPADVWSLACTIYTLLTGEHFTEYGRDTRRPHDMSYITKVMSPEMKHEGFKLYTAEYEKKHSVKMKTARCKVSLLDRVKELIWWTIRDPSEKVIIENLADLMIYMLDPDPRTRPTMRECLQHPVFGEFLSKDNIIYTPINPVTVPKKLCVSTRGPDRKTLKIRRGMMAYLNKIFEEGKTGSDSASLVVTVIDRVLADKEAYDTIFAEKSDYDISKNGALVVRASLAICDTLYYGRYFYPDINGGIDWLEDERLVRYIRYIFSFVLDKNVYAVSV